MAAFAGVVLLGAALLSVAESRRPPSPPPGLQQPPQPGPTVPPEPKSPPSADPIAPLRSSEAIQRAFRAKTTDRQSLPGFMAQARPALWRVADADTTIYLFGTIHLLRPGLEWFDAELQQVFATSSELVVEALETDPTRAAGQLLSRAIDRDGPPLSQKLTAAAARRYRTAMRRLGLSIDDFEQLEPWFVTMFISNIMLQQFGYGAGVDEALVEQALASGKPVISLETMDFQLSIFDQMPERSQLRLLDETIAGLDQPPRELERITQLWATGQAEALAIGRGDTTRTIPGHYSALITKRNKRWTDWLVNRLDRPGKVFVAVGAAHFAGDESVLRMLRARNFKVTRLR
ncbi:MAG: TraB/GumN family protein [Cyanobacteriota bacterium]